MAKFKLVAEHEFKWPVKIKIPSSTRPGQWETQQIDMTFRAITQDEGRRISAEQEALNDEIERADHQQESLRRAIIGWDENSVLDDDGNPVPFSEEALDQALQMPWVRIAAFEAYARAISGDAAKGN